jgi:RND family efflux transporter MFP subunit
LGGEKVTLLRIGGQLMIPAAMAVALALGLAGCESQPAHSAVRQESASTAGTLKPVAADPARDRAQEPVSNPDSFTTTGPLVVDQQADVLAERDGRVVEIRAEIADHVAKNQVLARLDSRELQASRAAAAAKVESLKAEVREWKAEQEVNAADLRRADMMRSASIMDLEDWEHVKYKLQETIAEVARYQADESAAEFQLRALDIQMEQSSITAPFSGVIGRRSVRAAQEVKKGDPLFWVTAERPLHILFTIPESQLRSIHAGVRLGLTTQAYPDLYQVATVRRVSPVVDPSSGSLEVIGDLNHPSPLLKPGMSMQVHLDQR